jgi:hypothetical protein
MIITKTLLILGAGASMDYGFPSGEMLIDEIINFIDGASFELNIKNRILLSLILQQYYLLTNTETNQLLNIKNSLKDCYKDVMDFYNILINSSPASIDDFLYQSSKINKSYEIIGKALIVLMISKYENAADSFLTYVGESPENNKYYNGVKFRKLKRGWYSYLWKKLYEGSTEDDLKNSLKNLTIISFNYDRSLEYFLHSRIMNMFNKTSEESTKIMNDNFYIHHVYGQIGLFNIENKSNHSYAMQNEYKPIELGRILDSITTLANTNTFDDELKIELQNINSRIDGIEDKLKKDDIEFTLKRLCHLVSKIKTYHEDTTTLSPEIKKLKEQIHNTAEVFFLGFGYLEQNMEYLKENILAYAKPNYFGTMYGIGRDRMLNILNSIKKSSNGTASWLGYNINAPLMKDYNGIGSESDFFNKYPGFNKMKISEFFSEIHSIN